MIALLASLALGGTLTTVEPEPARTLITNVAVLGTDGSLEGIHDVVLADGKIEALLPVGDGWDVPVERTVDGSGATLLPGLIDAHVHLSSAYVVPGKLRLPSPRENLDQMLFWGVTTVLDLDSDRDALDGYRERIESGRWSGPAMLGSGRPFTAVGGHPISTKRAVFGGPIVRMATAKHAHQVATSDDVDDGLAREGASGFTKVMLDELPDGTPVIRDEALARLRVGATALGDTLIAHAGTPADLQRALDLPVDALAHLPYAGEVSPSQLDGLVERHIPAMPTLGVWLAAGLTHEGRPLDGALEAAAMTAKQRKDLGRAAMGKGALDHPGLAPWADALVAGDAQRAENARKLYDGGATLLVGSDSPGMGWLGGAALHREIALWVEAGIPREAVLSAVTWENSRFLDEDARYGAVKPGWEADLLLVEGDPTQDLGALQAIRELWVDGRRVTRTPAE